MDNIWNPLPKYHKPYTCEFPIDNPYNRHCLDSQVRPYVLYRKKISPKFSFICSLLAILHPGSNLDPPLPIVLTLGHSVALVMQIAAHESLGSGVRVIFGTVGTQVLHGSVCEDLVIDIGRKSLLKTRCKKQIIEYTSFYCYFTCIVFKLIESKCSTCICDILGNLSYFSIYILLTSI